MINWKYKKSDVTIDQLKEFEKAYNIILPQDFKQVVLLHNGARPNINIFDTVTSKERIVRGLLSFNKEDKGNIYEVLGWSNEGLPRNLIPIMDDPGGNYICYEFSDQGTKVVYWISDYNNTEFICNTFSEFLDLLYEE